MNRASLLILVMLLSVNVWGENTTYTFTSKSWADATSSWTSGKDGNGYTNNQGVQITSGVTGANATTKSSFTNVSKIVVNYCTNAKAGKGTIKVQVGNGTEKSYSVSAPSSGGTTLRNTDEFTFSPTETGQIKITVECGTNSIYINSITITTAASKTLSSISVKTAPSKTTYTEGEYFDPTGLVITKTFTDATTEDLAYAGHTSDFTFSPSTSTALTTSNTSVTITVGGKSTTQTITVNSKPKYTVTFNAGSGTCSTSSLTETSADAGVTLPSASPSSACDTEGWTFAGWKETSAQSETTTAPTLLAAGANYKPSSNCTLYAVYSKTEGGSGPTKWIVATSIAEGDVVVISTNQSYTTQTMKTAGTISSNLMGCFTSTYNSDKSEITSLASGTLQFTVGGNSTSGYTLKNGDNYLGMSGDKKVALSSTSSTWSISFGGTTATVSQLYSSKTYNLQYNHNQGNDRFTGYTSNQVAISLFKKSGSASTTTYTTSPECGSSCTSRTITFAGNPTMVEKTTADAPFTYVASIDVADGQTIGYSSSDTKVATVAADGTVTIVGAGTTTITASVPATDTYCEASASYTVNVTKPVFSCWDGSLNCDFTKINGFSEWTSTYSQHVVNYTNLIVTFTNANKNSGTITDCPVTKGSDVTFVAAEQKVITKIHVECKQWTDKTQTITLNYSTDGGTNYQTLNPSVSSEDFEIESTNLPEGTNAVKLTFSSSSNQIGIASACVTIEDVPTLNSINVKTAPSKVTYNANETFNPAGLVINAVYSNGTKEIPYAGNESSFTFTPSTSTALTTDNKKVTITYTDKQGNTQSVDQNITVNLLPTTITLASAIQNIEAGESVDDLTTWVAFVTGASRTFEFTSGDDEIFFVDGTEGLAGENAGQTTVTVKAVATNVYAEATEVVTVNVLAASDPKLEVDPTIVEFTNKIVGQSYTSENIALMGENLTADATIEISGTDAAMFTAVDEDGNAISSIEQADGEILADIYVKYAPTAAGTHSATMTISSTTANVEVTLSGSAKASYTVKWSINGVIDETKNETVLDGNKVTSVPTATSCDPTNIAFLGWTNNTITDAAEAPEILFTDVTSAPAVTEDVTYQAVFAEIGGTGEILDKELTTAEFDTWTVSSSNTSQESNYRKLSEGGWVETTEFDLSKITKIVVYGGTYGGSSNNKLNIKDANGNLWKAVTVSGDKQTGVNTYTGGNALSGTGKIRVISGSTSVRVSKVIVYTQEKDITYSHYSTTCEIKCAAPAFSPAECTFAIPFDVTLTNNQDGATVYYTTDDTNPTTGSSSFTGANTTVPVSATTTTIKAMAAKEGMANSDIVSATYTYKAPLTTMQAIFDASETEDNYYITFNNWVVSGVSSSTAYLTDNAGNGLIIYKSGHDFAAGDVLSGTVQCALKRYDGSAEITNVTSSTTGLTVTKDGTLTPIVTTIDALSGVNTGALIDLGSLTYSGDNVFSDDESHSITAYNTLMSPLPTWVNGNKYKVSGIYLQNNTTREILPRSEADIVPYYNVTFDLQGHGTAITSLEALSGTTIAAPTAPSAVGYTFGGWYKEEACTNAWDFTNDQVTAATTLYAKWTVSWKFRYSGDSYADHVLNNSLQYTISLDGNTTYWFYFTEGYHTYALAGESTMTSENCTNWNFQKDNNTHCGITTTATGDYTFTINDDDAANKLVVSVTYPASALVTFDMNGHGDNTTTYVALNATVTEPEAPTALGYTFQGWYTDQACTDANRWNFASDPVTADITLYAKWTEARTTLYLSPGVWNVDNAKYAVYYFKDAQRGWSDLMTLAPCETNIYTTTIPQGYTTVIFVRLSSDATTGTWEAKWNQTDNITLADSWDQCSIVEFMDNANSTHTTESYVPSSKTITFNDNGANEGATMAEQQVNCGEDITLTTMTRTKGCYDFAGWTANVDVKVKGTTITAGNTIANGAMLQEVSSDITLTAVWTAASYTFKYEGIGGYGTSCDYSVTIPYNQAITACTPDAREGYTFNGWTRSDGEATIAAGEEFNMPCNDLTLTADYTRNHYSVTWSVNGGPFGDPVDYEHGTTLALPSTNPDAPTACSEKVFVGWTTEENKDYSDESTAPALIKAGTAVTANANYYAVFAARNVATTTDNLTRATTGVESEAAGYSTWQNKQVTSSAVYAGQSAGGSSAIQLRTENSNSGIITTTSGGKVTKVTVTWNSNTASGRTLDIYGKNTVYESAADLYDNTKQGTKIGSIVYGTSTELSITDDYAFIGLRSSSGAMYLDAIGIEWTNTSYADYATTCEARIPQSLALTGEYPTTFDVNDDFSHDGLVATVTYTNSTQRVVTEDVTFVDNATDKEVDMSTAGTKTVKVSYTENETTVSATYTITVRQPYYVTYDANGAIGTVPTDANKYYTGDEITVAAQGDLTKDAHRFGGWSYNSTTYQPDEKVTVANENVILTAVWEAKQPTIITLNENGTETVWEGTHYIDDAYVLPSAPTTPVVNGYMFVGWSTTAITDPTTKPTEGYYPKGTEYTPKAATETLYAVYARTRELTSYDTERITDESGIEAGGMYIIEQAGHVMTNTAIEKKQQTTTTYSLSGLTDSENYVWTLEQGTNAYYLNSKSTHVSNTPYLKQNGGDMSMVAQANASQWTLSFNQGYCKIAASDERFLGLTGTNTWTYKAYASINYDITNSNVQFAAQINLYRLVGQYTTSPKGGMITFSENGETTQVAASNETGRVTYTAKTPCTNRRFMGWSNNSSCTTQTAPDYVDLSSHVFSGDATLYAVYASINGGKITGEAIHNDNVSSYVFSPDVKTCPMQYATYTLDENTKFQSSQISGTLYIGFGLDASQADAHITTTKIKDLKSISFDYITNGAAIKYYVMISADGSEWTKITADNVTLKSNTESTYTISAIEVTQGDYYVKVGVTQHTSTGKYAVITKMSYKCATCSYWYSDYSTSCDIAASTTMTFVAGEDAIGTVPEPINTAGWITLPEASTLTKDCDAFAGWQVTDVDDYTQTYQAGDKYLLNHDVTMTAQWSNHICATGSLDAADAYITTTNSVAKKSVLFTLSFTNIEGETVTPVITDDDASLFSVTDGQINKTDETVTSYTFRVQYTPTAASTTNMATLTFTDGAGIPITDSEEQPLTMSLHGRSVADQIVLAAKVGSTWYALPANMNGANTYAGVPITVDNADNPTTASSVSNEALYTLRALHSDSESDPSRVRFASTLENNKALWGTGSTSSITINNNAQITTANGDNYDWILTTTDLNSYTLTNNRGGDPRNLGLNRNCYWGLHAPSNTASADIRMLAVGSTLTYIPMTVTNWQGQGFTFTPSVTIPIYSSIRVLYGGTTFTTDVTLADNTLTIPSIDFDDHSGEALTVEWLDENSNPVAMGVVTTPIFVKGAEADLSTYDPDFLTTTEVFVLNGAKLTVSANCTIKNLTVEGGGTVAITGGTIKMDNLSLRGGLNATNGNNYAMPRLYIAVGATLQKTQPTVNFDITVDKRNYYPFAVPFSVPVSSINYVDPVLSAASIYGTHYVIKTYDGAHRAEYGENKDVNWKVVESTETLQPGVGYILTAVTPAGYDSRIRIPMEIVNGWTTDGEQSSFTTESGTVTRDTVTATAHTGTAATTHQRHAGWNFVANPYLAGFAGSENITGEHAYINGKVILTGDPNSPFGYSDDEVPYVSVPTYDFSEYIQTPLSEAVLSPEWSFFVQIGTSGTMTFAKTGRQQSAPSYLMAQNDTLVPRKLQTTLVLSDGNNNSDKTGLIISNRYTTAYEIGADLEKMFGNGYTLATYTIVGGTRLAYNALSETDAHMLIPVGYRAPEAGTYTFALDITDEMAAQFERIDLIDYETGELTNLLTGSYTFTTERTQSDERFAINATIRQVPTDLDDGALDRNDGVQKVIYDGHLYIIDHNKVYDGTGSLITIKVGSIH